MSSSKSSSGQFRMNEGDWVCVDASCGNINFARRQNCNLCGKEKPGESKHSSSKKKLGHEIGKAAAEKSKGLFSADDWQCGRCGNVNWARRQQCNMCNAPKFGENEERTGLGGGYNERDENIEYVEREESDSEYDDFGRKKKKFREGLNETSNSSDKKYDKNGKDEEDKEEEESEDDDDDDEDDEEDGDISKYKLDSDDEEDDDEDADLSKYDLGGDSDENQNESETDHVKKTVKRRLSESESSSSSSNHKRAA